MIYLDLVRRLKQETGVAGPLPAGLSNTVGETAKLVNWVRDGWLEIQKKPFRWKWMRRTLSGEVNPAGGMSYTADLLLQVDPGTTSFSAWRPASRDYTVQAGRQDNSGLWDLQWIEQDVWRRMFLTSVVMGPPQFWSISDANELLIGPYPDVDYDLRVEHQKGFQELAEDADAPEMPSEHHMLIVWFALSEYGSFDAAPEVVARAERNFAGMWPDLMRTQAEQAKLDYLPLCERL